MSQTYVPGRVHVHGASLAGLAAAARLAKAGHEVVIDAAGLPDGGHWAARNHLGVSVDELPQTFLLPAAWRDLFKKSGRALDAELARHQLELVPAAGQLHRFADGAELLLPAERGAQFHAVAQAFGQSAAEAWTTLVDELDELWQRLRMAGLERPVTSHTFDRPTRAALLAERSIDELAQRAGDPHLACVVRAQAPICGAAPGRNPALLAVRLAVLRRFGSWQLVDTSGDRPRAQRPSRLLELLTERLQLRGVERVGAPTPLLGTGAPDLSRLQSRPEVPADARLEALPVLPGPGFLGRRPARPAQAPTVNHRIVAAAGNLEDIAEVVDHCTGTPVVTWRRPLPDGRVVETIHDHNRSRPDLAWGLAPTTWRAWQQRPPLGGEGQWYASAASHAGAEPWAELLSGALAVYEIHDHLTGTDIRPTNRNPPQPPRRRGAARG